MLPQSGFTRALKSGYRDVVQSTFRICHLLKQGDIAYVSLWFKVALLERQKLIRSKHTNVSCLVNLHLRIVHRITYFQIDGKASLRCIQWRWDAKRSTKGIGNIEDRCIQ